MRRYLPYLWLPVWLLGAIPALIIGSVATAIAYTDDHDWYRRAVWRLVDAGEWIVARICTPPLWLRRYARGPETPKELST